MHGILLERLMTRGGGNSRFILFFGEYPLFLHAHVCGVQTRDSMLFTIQRGGLKDVAVVLFSVLSISAKLFTSLEH